MVSAQRIAFTVLQEYSVDVSLEEFKMFGFFTFPKSLPHNNEWVRWAVNSRYDFEWIVHYGGILAPARSSHESFFEWARIHMGEVASANPGHPEVPLKVLPKKYRNPKEPFESFRQYYAEELHKPHYTWEQGEKPEWLKK